MTGQTPYSMETLDAAIATVIGADVATHMIAGHIGRTSRHQNAVCQAFLDKRDDEATDILRAAWRDLKDIGQYNPTPR